MDDLFYTKAPLLASVDTSHAITAFTAVMMSALVTVGFIFRPRQRAVLKLTWISLGLLLFYILNTWIHYQDVYKRQLHELLAFLQAGDIVVAPIDLNALVKDALNIARSDGYKEFQPALELEQNLPQVLANRIQIQKVLVNLIRNAVEAMRSIGTNNSTITVTVRTNKNLNMGHVSVQDSGPGIPAEAVKRMFEPFFTTKPTGIGMGLAISRALVESNGGQLWLEPNVESGAIFHFTLPFAP